MPVCEHEVRIEALLNLGCARLQILGIVHLLLPEVTLQIPLLSQEESLGVNVVALNTLDLAVLVFHN